MTHPTSRYDLVTIGGGAAGLTVSRIVAAAGKKVALVERDRPGGDCLWTGCVPTKALIEVAQRLHDAHTGARFGLSLGDVQFDYARARQHVAEAQAQAGAIESPEAIASHGIELFRGDAHFLDAHTAEFEGGRLIAENIVIATGSEASVPPLPGLHETGFETNVEVLDWTTLPNSLCIIGGGPIGIEFAQMMNRLGVRVAVLEAAPHILPREDTAAAAIVAATLAGEGVQLFANAVVERIEKTAPGKRILLAQDGIGHAVESDRLLVATGRRPRLGGLRIEAAGVALVQGRLVTDDQLRTSQKHIFAIGDVASKYQFTHVAEAQGRLVANILLGKRHQKWSDRVIPRVTFTDPEVASVGLNENEARAAKVRGLRVWTLPLSAVDRAITMGRTEGFLKVLTAPGWNRFVPGLRKLMGDEIVGACLVGPHAGDLLMPLVVAMRAHLPMGIVAWNMQAYPTLALGVRQVTGQPFES